MKQLPPNFTDFLGNRWSPEFIANYNKLVSLLESAPEPERAGIMSQCVRLYSDTVDLLDRMSENA